MRALFHIISSIIIFCNYTPPVFAQWQFLGSPEIGTPLNFDAEGDTILVCTRTGIFYSRDYTETWHSLPTPREANFPREVFIEKGTLYLSASDYAYNNTSLYRSDDFGDSWIDISQFLSTNARFTYMFPYGDTLLIVMKDTLALSFDKGSSYQVFPSSINPDKIFYFKNRIMGKYNDALLESFDFGITWDTVYQTPNYFLSDVSPIDGVLWKAENINFNHAIEITRSEDNGMTWSLVYSNDSSGIVVPSVMGEAGKLFITDFSSSMEMFFSADAGANWISKDIPNNASLSFYHDGVLFFGDYNNMHISTNDGDSFTLDKPGFLAASVDGFTLYDDDLWIKANFSMFKKSGDDWSLVPNAYSVVTTIEGDMVGFIDFLPKRSSNGGMTWTTIPPDAFGQPFYYSFMAIMGEGNVLYINSGSDTYSSDDGGFEWNRENDEFSIVEYNQYYVAAEYLSGDIWISDDGINWQNITFNLDAHIFLDVPTVHDHKGSVFVGSSEGFFRLPAFSKNWEQIPGPVSATPGFYMVPEVTTMKSHNNILIAGVKGYGVYISGDNGTTWQQANQGLEDLQVLSSVIIEGELYIGVEGGVWKRPLSELIISSVSKPDKKLSFSISPSPVTDYLYVSIDEPNVFGEMKISLFDSKGAFIKSQSTSNSDNIQVNVQDISPGTYFLHVRFDDRHGIITVVKN